MTNQTIRWGILGTSKISETQAKAIQETPNSELLAIGSRQRHTAEKFAQQFSVPHYYTDYHELLQNPDIDAVYIGLPNHLHKEWIIHAARAHKHILCEKPLVLTPDDVEDVMDECEDANVVCMEALMYKHHPFTQKLHDIMNSGVIGDIKLFNATYTANIAAVANPTAGGSIRNLGCYPVSLVRALAASEPTEITALGRMNATTNHDSQASIIMKFENDMMAVVSTADDIDMHWQFNVYGSKGHITVISNPWMPGRENNKVMIYANDQAPQEIIINADRSLYSYQIEVMNKLIWGEEPALDAMHILEDSLGNAAVLHACVENLVEVTQP